MGMFDRFYHRCPNCGRDVEWQSKAGECALSHYTLADIPKCIAGDLDGQSEQCKCGKTLTVHTTVVVEVS